MESENFKQAITNIEILTANITMHQDLLSVNDIYHNLTPEKVSKIQDAIEDFSRRRFELRETLFHMMDVVSDMSNTISKLS